MKCRLHLNTAPLFIIRNTGANHYIIILFSKKEEIEAKQKGAGKQQEERQKTAGEMDRQHLSAVKRREKENEYGC